MRAQTAIYCIDEYLDTKVSEEYTNQPLAQDWARISKICEELGEAIQALIGFTGQNPRKGINDTKDHMLKEILDVAATAILAHQHFTKNDTTWTELERHINRLHDRICDARKEQKA